MNFKKLKPDYFLYRLKSMRILSVIYHTFINVCIRINNRNTYFHAGFVKMNRSVLPRYMATEQPKMFTFFLYDFCFREF